nr:hypothetical protein [uncultured Oscillibacter sp.]
MTEENRDFKYVMQDVSKVYIGAKYTYQEMMDTDEIPFKLKAILSHYILKEVAGDTTPENHIFYIKDTDLSYLVYKQMKARFKLDFPVRSPKGTWQYRSEYHTIEEIAGNAAWKEKQDEIVVEEMVLTKLHMMMMSL